MGMAEGSEILTVFGPMRTTDPCLSWSSFSAPGKRPDCVTENLHTSVKAARKGPGTEDSRRYLENTTASSNMTRAQGQRDSEYIIIAGFWRDSR